MTNFLQACLIVILLSGCTTVDNAALRPDGAELTKQEAVRIAEEAGVRYGFNVSPSLYRTPLVDYSSGLRRWSVFFEHRQVRGKYDFSVWVDDATGKWVQISYEADPNVIYGDTR